MKTSTAYMITSMLKSVTTVNDLGYYSTLNPTSPSYTQAGKSGTSDYASDSKFAEGKAQDLWFTGYTKSAVISVWNGYDEPNNINVALDGISGSASGNTSRLPLQIYHALMNYVMSEESNADGSKWKMPSTVEESTTSAGDYNVKDADPTGVFTTDSGTALTASVGIGMNSADATTQIISSSSSSAGISSYSSSSSSVKSSSISSVSSSSSSSSSSSATTTSTPASGATDNTGTAATTNTGTTKSSGN
jgi:penicillin-binding protein 1A